MSKAFANREAIPWVVSNESWKTIWCAHYSNNGNAGVSIVAVASRRSAGGEYSDWAAYIYAGDPWDERQLAHMAAKDGIKLREEDARWYFGMLNKIPYRA
jgi:hypothetical protein